MAGMACAFFLYAASGLVAPGWVAGMAGALAGAALFGGSPLASLFWLTLGVVAATPLLVLDPRS